MEAELGVFSRDNKALQLAMSQKDLRLDATSREMLQERQQVHVHIRTVNITITCVCHQNFCLL